jgi:hypothetical protein
VSESGRPDGVHLVRTSGYFGPRTHDLGRGADTLRVDERGARVAEAVALVEKHVGPVSTLAVLPEGAMVNYLSGVLQALTAPPNRPMACV